MINAVLVDNYDSFTNNLLHLLTRIADLRVRVIPYLEFSPDAVGDAELLILSPGPGSPRDYPGYQALLSMNCPVLGICLGMQVMNHLLGGGTGKLSRGVHGKTSPINILGQVRLVARYHSLYCHPVSELMDVVAVCDQGVPMALAAKGRPWFGYQFHPESFLTPDGEVLLGHAINQVLVHSRGFSPGLPPCPGGPGSD